jgi:molybdate transport system substrate-binding protein
MPRLLIAALISLVVGCAPSSGRVGAVSPGGSITVFAASSLTDAFTKAGNAFTGRVTGSSIRFNFGSSSTLATQITNGAPADIFASADEPNMQKIVEADLVNGSPAVFAANRLEIAVAPGNPKRIASLSDLARPGTVVVIAAPTVPAGKYALDSLNKAGVSLSPASQEIDVRAVLNKVALGEADAGIVYVTDVRSAGSRVTGVAIPEGYQVVARYPIAVVRGSANASLARAFADYLLSNDGQALLAGFGFSPS